MSVDVGSVPTRKAVSFPLYRTFSRFVRDPLRELERISAEAGGELIRLDLGASRPYLATHPDHVQQVLRRESQNFVRDGMFWRPLRGLFGASIMSEFDEWELSKRILQPVFSTKHVRALTESMADAINAAVDTLEAPAHAGEAIEILPEMGRIVHETVIKVLFGNKIRQAEADRLVPGMEKLATSIAYRFLLPFVPRSIPLPGDRAFAAALEMMDETLYELVDRYRDAPGEGFDIFTALCQARMTEGSGLDDQWVRDNLLSMWATSIETTTVALTWIWPILDRHPEVAGRLRKEIDEVVGGERVRPEHLHRLPYVKQVIQELLRLYPVGWIFPRIAQNPTSVGGVPIKAGDTVLVSPYLTHRLESVWEDPLRFDPERFSPERARTHHRYAYYPFGGGPHMCIGRHVFNFEAELILTSILSRFRPEVRHAEGAIPKIGATIRPRNELKMTLVPLRSAA
ncbi:cytochrome P450 [Actinomadura sp. NBRC 104412]|uniref:cytochrome P450 n=1 Tax=Actinomadura sp. NBRC 104412 TaxID=3032203 RepID=UPI0024A556EF|nr:cytochrome P450 [Actinomadura sp. NBRC 104412]GLZ06447.1 cytochrome P450 [Actinomadura sp. NBRC 104412]